MVRVQFDPFTIMQVEQAMDGSEALAFLKTNSTLPDLILLDVMMPGMNGFEVRIHALSIYQEYGLYYSACLNIFDEKLVNPPSLSTFPPSNCTFSTVSGTCAPPIISRPPQCSNLLRRSCCIFTVFTLFHPFCQVCQEIRKSHNKLQIPIIMVSAKGNPEDIMQGLQAGASDYVKKPFHRQELLTRIRSQIQSRCVTITLSILD